MPVFFTTVPSVVSALVALGHTTLDAQGVTICDGPPDDGTLAGEFLSIGWTRDEEESAVAGSFTSDANATWSESYSVRCVLSCATGDMHPGAVAERRNRCATLWGLFAAALQADPHLGGVLVAGAVATPSRAEWVYGPSVEGVYAELDFDIDVRAGYLGANWQ